MGLKVKDIAEILNVSTATVSLVLNNKPGVSEDTRQRVMKLVADMGYDTNALSKPALKNNKSIRFVIYKKHGNIVTKNPFFSPIIEGIDQEARKNGYNLLITYVNEKENIKEVFRIIQDNPLDGMIILATEMNREDLQSFKKLCIPIVLLDNYFLEENIDSVVINNIQGSYEAVRFLIAKGHTEIGYLSGATHINNFAQRMIGLHKALDESNLKFNKKYFFSIDTNMEGAYKDMASLLKSGQCLPTAFFADNDIIASGAVKAMKEAGISVPGDISIVGFDDQPFCQMIEPQLTTIKVYKQRLGVLAVRRLLDRIDKNVYDEFVNIQVGTELVERESVYDISSRQVLSSKQA